VNEIRDNILEKKCQQYSVGGKGDWAQFSFTPEWLLAAGWNQVMKKKEKKKKKRR